MKKTHSYDIYGRTEPSTIYLASPGRNILCAVNGVDSSSVSLKLRTKDTAELSFTVNKYIDENVISNAYDNIEEMMELYCDGIWFKIVEPPKISNNGTKESKDVVAESYEVVLTQYTLNDFEVNTGSSKSYEKQYKVEYDLNHPGNPNHDENFVSGTYFQVKFCDKTTPKLSLLHLILEHSGAAEIGWTIGYIDDITPDDETIEDNKKKYLKDYVSNYKVDDKSVYSFLTQEVSKTCRCIFDFDTVNLKINAYRPKTLGIDTGIFLGFRNIQNNIEVSRDDSMVTQFRVSGLDEYGIADANIGENVITDITYFMKAPYMDDSLIEKYSQYLNNRDAWRMEYEKYSKYRAILNDKMTEIKNRVPVDSAKTDYFSFSMDDLQSAYTSNCAILAGLEKTYVDDENKFDISELKKYKDDWDLYESIKNYTIPTIIAAMQYKKNNGSDYKEGDFIPTGTGNLLSDPNPVILGTSWIPIGDNVGEENLKICQFDGTDKMSTSIEDFNGITRYIKLFPKATEKSTGIKQKKIHVTTGREYTLSFYVWIDKSSPTAKIYCGHNTTGDDTSPKEIVYLEPTSTWHLYNIHFTAPASIIDISIEAYSANLAICGMQLEEGSERTSFGYYIQPSDSIKSYETDWDLYGIDELKVKIKTYENCITSLKSQGYDVPYELISGEDADYATQMYHNYLGYKDLLQQAQKALETRQKEYDYYKDPGNGNLIEIDKTDDDGKVIIDKATGKPYKIQVPGISQISSLQQKIKERVDLNNWGISSENLDGNIIGTPFTAKELKLIRLLCRQASYKNDNIITTSLTTPESSIKQQELLYKDAVSNLYISAHPQYIYSDTIENIYALPEFKEYHDKLNVNDYVYLSMGDSETYTRLRVIEIEYNPCDLDENMTVTFSNMIQYELNQNDYETLLNNITSSGSYDGGQVEGVSKNADSSSYVLSADVIQQMFSNPLFLSKINGATSTGSSATINIGDIISEFCLANEDKFLNLSSNSGFVIRLDKEYLTKSLIVSKLKSDSSDNDINKIFNKNISVTSTTSDVKISNAKISESTLSSCILDSIEISDDAASSIAACHTHEGLTQIATLMETVSTLQEEVSKLKEEISQLKSEPTT